MEVKNLKKRKKQFIESKIFFNPKEWFFEKNQSGVYSTIQTGIKIRKRILKIKSNFQEIEIIDTYPFGRVLVLDGIIQLSKRDEFIYHEMLVHPALFLSKIPKRVLVIGGGDGGVLRELLKHPIKEVYLVEIDEEVIKVSKRYLPFVSQGAFEEKRVKVIIDDGLKFVKKFRDYFDVIIIDSTDPGGPSLSLFSKKFYKDVFSALKEDGLIALQSGCLFEQYCSLKRVFKKIKSIFPFAKVYKAGVPCFQCSTEYTFILASKKKIEINRNLFKKIEKKFSKFKDVLLFYSPRIFFSSLVLPEYLKKELGDEEGVDF